jgi:site-specific DNA-methyltransferase (adenine-specific)
VKPYYIDEWVTIYCGLYEEILPRINIKVDMILTDPPYGITACKWDSNIDFGQFWEIIGDVTNENTPIVITGSQPFSSLMVTSKLDWFKYEWIWQKNAGSNFAVMKYQPMKEHESVLIFSKGTHNYYPIQQERAESGKERVKTVVNYRTKTEVYGGNIIEQDNNIRTELRFPSSVQKFNRERGLHPTQKPLALFEYLVKTYTTTDNLVVDCFMGSGTTAIACKRLKRYCIGIESDERYCEIIAKRCQAVNQAVMGLVI